MLISKNELKNIIAFQFAARKIKREQKREDHKAACLLSAAKAKALKALKTK